MQSGDIGANITVTVTNDSGTAINLTGATSLSMYLLSPGGVAKTFTPTLFDAAAGQIRYTTAAATDLNEHGVWSVQVGYTLAGFVGRSSVSTFSVGRNL